MEVEGGAGLEGFEERAEGISANAANDQMERMIVMGKDIFTKAVGTGPSKPTKAQTADSVRRLCRSAGWTLKYVGGTDGYDGMQRFMRLLRKLAEMAGLAQAQDVQLMSCVKDALCVPAAQMGAKEKLDASLGALCDLLHDLGAFEGVIPKLNTLIMRSECFTKIVMVRQGMMTRRRRGCFPVRAGAAGVGLLQQFALIHLEAIFTRIGHEDSPEELRRGVWAFRVLDEMLFEAVGQSENPLGTVGALWFWTGLAELIRSRPRWSRVRNDWTRSYYSVLLEGLTSRMATGTAGDVYRVLPEECEAHIDAVKACWAMIGASYFVQLAVSPSAVARRSQADALAFPGQGHTRRDPNGFTDPQIRATLNTLAQVAECATECVGKVKTALKDSETPAWLDGEPFPVDLFAGLDDVLFSLPSKYSSSPAHVPAVLLTYMRFVDYLEAVLDAPDLSKARTTKENPSKAGGKRRLIGPLNARRDALVQSYWDLVGKVVRGALDVLGRAPSKCFAREAFHLLKRVSVSDRFAPLLRPYLVQMEPLWTVAERADRCPSCTHWKEVHCGTGFCHEALLTVFVESSLLGHPPERQVAMLIEAAGQVCRHERVPLARIALASATQIPHLLYALLDRAIEPSDGMSGVLIVEELDSIGASVLRSLDSTIRDSSAIWTDERDEDSEEDNDEEEDEDRADEIIRPELLRCAVLLMCLGDRHCTQSFQADLVAILTTCLAARQETPERLLRFARALLQLIECNHFAEWSLRFAPLVHSTLVALNDAIKGIKEDEQVRLDFLTVALNLLHESYRMAYIPEDSDEYDLLGKWPRARSIFPFTSSTSSTSTATTSSVITELFVPVFAALASLRPTLKRTARFLDALSTAQRMFRWPVLSEWIAIRPALSAAGNRPLADLLAEAVVGNYRPDLSAASAAFMAGQPFFLPLPILPSLPLVLWPASKRPSPMDLLQGLPPIVPL